MNECNQAVSQVLSRFLYNNNVGNVVPSDLIRFRRKSHIVTRYNIALLILIPLFLVGTYLALAPFPEKNFNWVEKHYYSVATCFLILSIATIVVSSFGLRKLVELLRENNSLWLAYKKFNICRREFIDEFGIDILDCTSIPELSRQVEKILLDKQKELLNSDVKSNARQEVRLEVARLRRIACEFCTYVRGFDKIA